MNAPTNLIDAWRHRGQIDGEEAARAAIRLLLATDDGAGFRREVERQIAELDARAAEMAERGVPADVLEIYYMACRAAFEAVLDRLGEDLVVLLPADDDEDEDEDA